MNRNHKPQRPVHDPHSIRVSLMKRRRPGEFAIEAFLMACGILSIITTVGIIFVLGEESFRFFASEEVTLKAPFGSENTFPSPSVFTPIVIGVGVN